MVTSVKELTGQICGDSEKEFSADGEAFVACSECTFPICRPCYEYNLTRRCQYLSNAVLQAKSANETGSFSNSSRGAIDNRLLDFLEGKLDVLQFQMIRDELEAMVSRLEASSDMSESNINEASPDNGPTTDANFVNAVWEKEKEISLDLKIITQLYNNYVIPFELWEICLEMLYFASYSGDADSNIVREVLARVIDQALTRGALTKCERQIAVILFRSDARVFLSYLSASLSQNNSLALTRRLSLKIQHRPDYAL